MSAPAEAAKATAPEVAKEAPKKDATVAGAADATHAAVAEAAKPAKPAKEVLVEFQAAHDAAGRKAIIEKLHLSPEEAKDAALQKSFKDAAHGDHDIEAAIDKKFTEAAHAKPAEAAHAAPDAAHGATAEKKADHPAEEKPHDVAHAKPAAGHAEEHKEGAGGEHKEEGHAAAPVVLPPAAHGGAEHGHGDESPGLIKRFIKNTFWELPKSLVQPPKLGLQVGGEILKGGWAILRGLFSKKYREETYSNPPVELKAAPKAANDNKEHDHHAHAA